MRINPHCLNGLTLAVQVSTLSAKQQKESIDQAIASAQALGLTDGVIHMEGKYTSEGARLIEANARMGGTYVMDWIKNVWGVDLSEEGMMAAARIPGKPYMPSQPIVHLDGDVLKVSIPGIKCSSSSPMS